MAKKPETTFKEYVADELATLPNLWCTKVQQVAIRGIPDIMGIVNSFPFVWELKKDAKEKASALQLYNLRRAKKAGGISRLVYPENFDECFAELKHFSELRLKLQRPLPR